MLDRPKMPIADTNDLREEGERPAITVVSVIQHLQQLRATLAHALQQRNISPRRFNEIREQIVPLDIQLKNLGAEPGEAIPQARANYVNMTRAQRRVRARANKFDTYENRVKAKLAKRGDDA